MDKYLDESKFELPLLVFPDRVRQSVLIIFPVYFRMFCLRDSWVTDAAGDRENERDRITINSGYGQTDKWIILASSQGHNRYSYYIYIRFREGCIVESPEFSKCRLQEMHSANSKRPAYGLFPQSNTLCNMFNNRPSRVSL